MTLMLKLSMAMDTAMGMVTDTVMATIVMAMENNIIIGKVKRNCQGVSYQN